MRIGHGFDVHKFGGDGPVIIGGVAVPYEQGLIAHSDGDVASMRCVMLYWARLPPAILASIIQIPVKNGLGPIAGCYCETFTPKYERKAISSGMRISPLLPKHLKWARIFTRCARRSQKTCAWKWARSTSKRRRQSVLVLLAVKKASRAKPLSY